MNITLSIEEEVVKRARKLAKQRGMSLNEYIRAYLKRMTDPMTPEEVIALLDQSLRDHPGDSRGETWTRDEIHDRTRFR